MRKIVFFITAILISSNLQADSSDWDSDDWDSKAISEMEKGNDTFKKMEVKNRSKKVYRDKVYKYIEDRDYNVKNNNIEIATVQLNNNLQSSDVKVDVMSEDLKVVGDRYKGDSIDLKRNDYKHFVKHDEVIPFKDEESQNQDNSKKPVTIIEPIDPLYQKVKDDDISELEVIDLRNKSRVKEVNVYIKNTTIKVGSNYEDK